MYYLNMGTIIFYIFFIHIHYISFFEALPKRNNSQQRINSTFLYERFTPNLNFVNLTEKTFFF